MAIQPSRKAIFCTDSIIRYNIIIWTCTIDVSHFQNYK